MVVQTYVCFNGRIFSLAFILTALVWFRDDLRLADNPALVWAASRGNIVPLFILDETSNSQRQLGAAQKWWLMHSLEALNLSLKHYGGKLHIRIGEADQQLHTLIHETAAKAIAWNKTYHQPSIKRDLALKSRFQDAGLEVADFNAHLIHDPTTLVNQSGGAFKVFTPFWKRLSSENIAKPASIPKMTFHTGIDSGDIKQLDLKPKPAHWAANWHRFWTPGEAGAKKRLEERFDTIFQGYSEQRNIPSIEATSRLSPHLRFGNISPRQIWYRTLTRLQRRQTTASQEQNAWAFLREIGWREFSHYLLFHFENLSTQNWRPEFDRLPWINSHGMLAAWQQAKTGYPIVDAGMRELWATGWMHNRVRMITASFLIKHLQTDWRFGEKWFWDTLVDACPANNPASWQWVAGSGADASPYFRIFNPITQSEKFDPEGIYLRRWVPELSQLDRHLIHRPWKAPALVLHAANIRLGDTYPLPIVDHTTARNASLKAYETVKRTNTSLIK